MKKAYFGIGAALLALLVCAMATGERFYVLPIVVIAALLLLALVMDWWTVATFQYAQKLAGETVPKGGQVRLDLRIVNNKPYPLFNTRLEYSTVQSALDGERQTVLVSILPGQSLQVEAEIDCLYRGAFEVGLARLTASDPFGLIDLPCDIRRFSYYKPLSLTVLPRVAELPIYPLPVQETEGSLHKRMHRTEDASHIVDLRKYRVGDPMRRIHWKLSARKRELLVKEYEDVSRPNALLLLDCCEHGLPPNKAVPVEDVLCESAAALVNALLRDRYPVRLVRYEKGRLAAEGADNTALDDMLLFLGKARFHSETTFLEAVTGEMEREDLPGSAFVFTCNPSDDFMATLNRLRRQGLRVRAVIAVPARDREIDKKLQILRNEGISALLLTPGDDVAAGWEAMP